MNIISTNEPIGSEVEELDTARRDCAVAWEAFKRARGRFMESILYEYGSVSARDRMAHRDLTQAERNQFVAEEKGMAQEAWLDYLDAEAHLGTLTVSFDPRHP